MSRRTWKRRLHVTLLWLHSKKGILIAFHWSDWALGAAGKRSVRWRTGRKKDVDRTITLYSVILTTSAPDFSFISSEFHPISSASPFCSRMPARCPQENDWDEQSNQEKLTGKFSRGVSSIISPKNSRQYWAILACCFGLQWFSKERTTGYSEVLKALSAMASMTSYNNKAVDACH